MRFSQHREEEVGISLTPLIDVVFLLLIFFMVSTTFSKESQLNLRLPTSGLPLETTLEEEVIFISISEQGQYVLKRGSDSSTKKFSGNDAVEFPSNCWPLPPVGRTRLLSFAQTVWLPISRL